MTSVVRVSLLLLAAAVLSACAQTGQVVPLAPAADVAESRDGNDAEVAVRVIDQRQSAELGRLENRRSGDAGLTTDQELDQVMAEAVAEALRRKGFRSVPWRENATRSLTVQIKDLQHVVSSDVPRKVNTRVELGFEAVNGSRGLAGSARHGHADTVTHRPGAEENGAWISDTLDAALRRMLSEQLLAFLAASG
ncbi:MAG: YajG family lipoprotein [Aquisalimonadaceae bacterium]